MGKITKQWSGLAKEYFTDADNFGIQCKDYSTVGSKGALVQIAFNIGEGRGLTSTKCRTHLVAKQLDHLVEPTLLPSLPTAILRTFCFTLEVKRFRSYEAK